MSGTIDYITINREEAQRAAMLFTALSINNNLNMFLKKLNIKELTDHGEVGIYFEYAKLRDLWSELDSDESRVDFIHNTLKIPLIKKKWEEAKKNANSQSNAQKIFNSNFVSRGEGGGGSKKVVESPSNWSLSKLNELFVDNNSAFLEACKYKWAFNIKPDIVIHLSNKDVICIEAKYCSKEGIYPSSTNDIALFKKRSIEKQTQTELQQYMFKVLDHTFKGVFITRTLDDNAPGEYEHLSWLDALDGMDLKTGVNISQQRLYEHVIVESKAHSLACKGKHST